METKPQHETIENAPESAQKDVWVKPAIASFAPVKAAEGISYRPTDGIANLT